MKPFSPKTQRLLQGPIAPTLARLAAPNMVGFLVGSGVMVAEMWFVGQLGTHALAGLALGYPFYMLVMMLSAGALGGAMAAAVARDRCRADPQGGRSGLARHYHRHGGGGIVHRRISAVWRRLLQAAGRRG